MATKSWFSVRILFVSVIEGDPNRDRLCEESIIVVEEKDEDGARQAARQLALGMEHGYRNEQGETVRWEVLDVLEIQDLSADKLENGTEVFSRLFFESQATDPEILHSLNNPTSTPP